MFVNDQKTISVYTYKEKRKTNATNTKRFISNILDYTGSSGGKLDLVKN